MKAAAAQIRQPGELFPGGAGETTSGMDATHMLGATTGYMQKGSKRDTLCGLDARLQWREGRAPGVPVPHVVPGEPKEMPACTAADRYTRTAQDYGMFVLDSYKARLPKD